MKTKTEENFRQQDADFQNTDTKLTPDHSFTENAEPDYGEDLVNQGPANKEFDGDNLANEEFDQENLDNDELDNNQSDTQDFDQLDTDEIDTANLDNEDIGNKNDDQEPFITG